MQDTSVVSTDGGVTPEKKKKKKRKRADEDGEGSQVSTETTQESSEAGALTEATSEGDIEVSSREVVDVFYR